MQCVLSTIVSKLNASGSRLTDLALVSQKTTNEWRLQTDNEYIYIVVCKGLYRPPPIILIEYTGFRFSNQVRVIEANLISAANTNYHYNKTLYNPLQTMPRD